jgi:hypothetical protein
MATCAHCGSEYVPGAIYCDKCGHSLPTLSAWTQRSVAVAQKPAAPAPPSEPEEPEVTEEPEITAAIEPEDPDFAEFPFTEFEEEFPEKQPHLRLQLTSGIIIDLGDRGRILIGRKDVKQQPEVDLTPYGGIEQGVSRQHAVITFKDGRYYIEDLNSVNETLLNSSRLFPGQPYPLRHGDQLQFGVLVVTVLLRQMAH